MNVTLVEINIKPERVDEFLTVFRANHEGAIAEPGNLRFDVLQDPKVKTRFYIYEAYRDDDAVLAHKETPHYKACVDVGAEKETQLYWAAAGVTESGAPLMLSIFTGRRTRS